MSKLYRQLSVVASEKIERDWRYWIVVSYVLLISTNFQNNYCSNAKKTKWLGEKGKNSKKSRINVAYETRPFCLFFVCVSFPSYWNCICIHENSLNWFRELVTTIAANEKLFENKCIIIKSTRLPESVATQMMGSQQKKATAQISITKIYKTACVPLFAIASRKNFMSDVDKHTCCWIECRQTVKHVEELKMTGHQMLRWNGKWNAVHFDWAHEFGSKAAQIK